MIKVLFIAKYGHDLTYFSTLKKYIESKKHLNLNVDLVFNIPFFFIEIFSCFKLFSLSQKHVEEALIPVIKRKIIKYGMRTAKFYSIWLSIIARLYYLKYRRILKQGKYNIICLWGGHTLGQSMAAVAAKDLGIRAFYFENGLLPNTTVMDYKGTNFNNSVPRSYEFYTNIPLAPLATSLVPRLTEKKLTEKVALPDKYIFCPFQVALDNQILLHSPWIHSMYQFYEILESVLALILEKNIVFVIKEHPSCSVDYARLQNLNNPRIIFANSNSTETLIMKSEMILTINSTVGIEGLLLEKKVVTLGNAFYSGFGFAKTATSAAELAAIINERNDWEIDKAGIKRFLSYLKTIYLIPGGWRSPSEEHMEKVAQKLLA